MVLLATRYLGYWGYLDPTEACTKEYSQPAGDYDFISALSGLELSCNFWQTCRMTYLLLSLKL